MTPRPFGKYLLDHEIARGGMSRVFAARLRGVGGFEKRLVVKQVLPGLARDPRFVAMFVHEAKTLVQMSHPHIAPVYELGVVDGVYFLAMEHVEGATLAEILADGPLPPGLAAHLGAELCDALHYAHTRFDLVHRDVTPRNVIVDSDGHSRLLDFGIATPLGDSAELFGTPGYLAPEQLEGGTLGAASDVFSLGAVLFEALTGRRAFDARTVEETRARLAELGPRFDEVIPRALAEIVERALARDPAARFGSARDFGRALRGWLAGAHPEGVAPELGLRAERVERAPIDDEPTEGAPDDGVTPGTREVRTLATSQALNALTEGTAAHEEPGTVPLERAPRVEPARAKRGWVLGAMPLAALALVVTPLVVMALWPEREPPSRATTERAQTERAQTERAQTERAQTERAQTERALPAPRAIDRASSPLPPETPSAPSDSTSEPEAPAPREIERAPAMLSINASPWAEVELDGRLLGRTPQRRVRMRPGRHTLTLRCPPLGREIRHAFDVEPGRALVLVADLTADPPVIRER